MCLWGSCFAWRRLCPRGADVPTTAGPDARSGFGRMAGVRAPRLALWGMAALVASASLEAGGTVGSNAESALDIALSGGGEVVLAFDGVLSMTRTKLISKDTILDATGHTVTLSGGLSNRLFFVNPGVSLTLRHLTLADGSSSGTAGIDGAESSDGTGGGLGVGGHYLVDTSEQINI